MDNVFDYFLKKYGEPTQVKNISDNFCEKYIDILPNSLFPFLQKVGFSSFENGLLWTTNPDEFKDILPLLTKGTKLHDVENNFVLARNAFGHLYVWNRTKGDYFGVAPFDHWLCPQWDGEIYTKEDLEVRIQLFYLMDKNLCDYTDVHDKPLFARALKKLGSLKPNEMYGFVPALSIGGKNELKYLQKVDMMTHLVMLSELQANTILDFSKFDNLLKK